MPMLPLLKMKKAGGAVPLIRESFQGSPDWTALNGRAPNIVNVPGTAWTDVGGACYIVSNCFGITGIGFYDAGVANGVMRLSLKMEAGQNFGLVARYTDSNNYWYLNFLTNSLKIVERNAGVDTTRATTAATLTVGLQQDVVATLDGTSISYTIEGYTVSYASSFNLSATRFGLRTLGNFGTTNIIDFRFEG